MSVHVWVITRWSFKTEEPTGTIVRHLEEVERLDGGLSQAEVARQLELKYARLYQPGWDEATSTVEEKAERRRNGEIVVGHEPQLVVFLVEVQAQPLN